MSDRKSDTPQSPRAERPLTAASAPAKPTAPSRSRSTRSARNRQTAARRNRATTLTQGSPTIIAPWASTAASRLAIHVQPKIDYGRRIAARGRHPHMQLRVSGDRPRSRAPERHP